MKQSNISVYIFYSESNGMPSYFTFSNEFKHLSTAVYDGEDIICNDFDRTGLLMRVVKCSNVQAFVKRLSMIADVSAVIVASIPKRHRFAWRPWWMRSCNEVARYTSGINLGFTFNPMHFYRKLLKYRHNRNYEILYAWRRKDGIR